MKVKVSPDQWGNHLRIWLYEENLLNRTINVVRIVGVAGGGVMELRLDPLDEGQTLTEPTLVLPREMAEELAEAILGKSGRISDELLETLRVERARVDKLLDFAIAPPVHITEVREASHG